MLGNGERCRLDLDSMIKGLYNAERSIPRDVLHSLLMDRHTIVMPAMRICDG